MQDFVGIRIADAAEQMRIGQRALDGVILVREPRGEGVAIEREDVDAAGIERCERGAAMQHVQRGAPLRSRFGEGKRPARKLEQRERDLCRRLPAAILRFRQPLQAPCNHQMHDEKVLVVEFEHDSLAEPRHAQHLPAVQRLERPFLHSARLAFTHPSEQKRMQFISPLPADLEAILDALPGWPPEQKER